MEKIIIYEGINVGEYAYDKIEIEEYYDVSNEYDHTDVVVNGEWWSHDLSTDEAIIKAFEYDPRTAKWLLKNLRSI